MGITSSAPKPATVSNPQGNTSTLEKWGNMFSGPGTAKIVPPTVTAEAAKVPQGTPALEEKHVGGKRKKSKSSKKSKKRTGKKTAKK